MTDNIVFKSKKEKNWLLTLLREQEITVKFVKKDGSEREMLCTLSESKIPAEKAPKGVERTGSGDVVPVFDIENQVWRSVRWDSITGIHFDLHK